jgi:hypothetical protein
MPIPVTDKISTTAPSDTYPTHDSLLGQGGHREVTSIAERDAIPAARRREGMTVFVKETTLTYQLRTGSGGVLEWVEYSAQDRVKRSGDSMTGPLNFATANAPASTGLITVDFAGANLQTITVPPGYEMVVSYANLSPGAIVGLRLRASGQPYALLFPSGTHFADEPPVEYPAGREVVISFTSYGNTAGDVWVAPRIEYINLL